MLYHVTRWVMRLNDIKNYKQKPLFRELFFRKVICIVSVIWHVNLFVYAHYVRSRVQQCPFLTRATTAWRDSLLLIQETYEPPNYSFRVSTAMQIIQRLAYWLNVNIRLNSLRNNYVLSYLLKCMHRQDLIHKTINYFPNLAHEIAHLTIFTAVSVGI